jgi:hypothetical protein
MTQEFCDNVSNKVTWGGLAMAQALAQGSHSEGPEGGGRGRTQTVTAASV